MKRDNSFKMLLVNKNKQTNKRQGFIFLIFAKRRLLFSLDLALCGKPPPVQDAQDWYQFTSIGANVFYVCNPGYSLLGPARRTCQANGTWDGVKPYCCM